jgi:hypothetical protein
MWPEPENETVIFLRNDGSVSIGYTGVISQKI